MLSRLRGASVKTLLVLASNSPSASVTVAEIAHAAGITPRSTTASIAELERLGLVTRTIVPGAPSRYRHVLPDNEFVTESVASGPTQRTPEAQSLETATPDRGDDDLGYRVAVLTGRPQPDLIDRLLAIASGDENLLLACLCSPTVTGRRYAPNGRQLLSVVAWQLRSRRRSLAAA
jgi:hypothetical protein